VAVLITRHAHKKLQALNHQCAPNRIRCRFGRSCWWRVQCDRAESGGSLGLPAGCSRRSTGPSSLTTRSMWRGSAPMGWGVGCEAVQPICAVEGQRRARL